VGVVIEKINNDMLDECVDLLAEVAEEQPMDDVLQSQDQGSRKRRRCKRVRVSSYSRRDSNDVS
jgi:hypothetical protein